MAVTQGRHDIHAPRTLDAARPAGIPEQLDAAIDRAVAWTEAGQSPEGYWVGMLQSNACMEAEWILAQHILNIDYDPKYEGVLRTIVDQQRSDGSWEVYHGAPCGDINTTVECYAAMRSAGFSAGEPRMKKAREWILANGGLSNVRVFTRYWLALIGEWPWSTTPTLPPELIRLPTWSPIHLYSFASWARATIVPLCVLSARRPVRPLPPTRRLDELFPDGRDAFDFRFPMQARPFTIEWFFHKLDRMLSWYATSPIRPGRETSIRLCLEWILKHQDADGAWGGIQPPWIYGLLALHAEGYPSTHPAFEKGLRAFDAHWSYRKDGAIHLQASDSIVWDTLLTLLALHDCDREPSRMPAMQSAVDWILEQEVQVPGDWSVNNRDVAPGGWAFERANLHYPDCDDTAVAILTLHRLRDKCDDPAAVDDALDRAEDWLRAMQCANGGWAAFDRDNTNNLVTKIPFADFGEMLDPPSVDVTAHVLEALAARGRTTDDPRVAHAVDYVAREQESDGSWFGRWGVNHIYGTGAVLPALEALGFPSGKQSAHEAAHFLARHQNTDGGWGETPASYMDDSLRAKGDSTPSQTAWALMALLAVGGNDFDTAIRQGVRFLLRRQTEDGTWDEPEYTGTGFPGYGVGERRMRSRQSDDAVTLDQGVELQRGFMLNYNLYRHYFPMMALGRARKRFQETT